MKASCSCDCVRCDEIELQRPPSELQRPPGPRHILHNSITTTVNVCREGTPSAFKRVSPAGRNLTSGSINQDTMQIPPRPVEPRLHIPSYNKQLDDSIKLNFNDPRNFQGRTNVNGQYKANQTNIVMSSVEYRESSFSTNHQTKSTITRNFNEKLFPWESKKSISLPGNFIQPNNNLQFPPICELKKDNIQSYRATAKTCSTQNDKMSSKKVWRPFED